MNELFTRMVLGLINALRPSQQLWSCQDVQLGHLTTLFPGQGFKTKQLLPVNMYFRL